MGRTVGRIFTVDVKDTDSRLIAHTLLGDANNLGAFVIERDRFHCSWELPGVEAFAR